MMIKNFEYILVIIIESCNYPTVVCSGCRRKFYLMKLVFITSRGSWAEKGSMIILIQIKNCFLDSLTF